MELQELLEDCDIKSLTQVSISYKNTTLH